MNTGAGVRFAVLAALALGVSACAPVERQYDIAEAMRQTTGVPVGPITIGTCRLPSGEVLMRADSCAQKGGWYRP